MLLVTLSWSQCSIQFSSVQSLSRVWLFVTPWTAARQASLSITNSWSPTKPRSLSQWCHPTISSSVVPFPSCPQPFPALGSFPMSQLFPWGGQSIGVSASASVLPMNTQDWSPWGWTGWFLHTENPKALKNYATTTHLCCINGITNHICLQHGLLDILSPQLRPTALTYYFQNLLLTDNAPGHPSALMKMDNEINIVFLLLIWHPF